MLIAYNRPKREKERERCSISLVIREMQVKTTVRSHCTHIRRTKILKIMTTPNSSMHAEKLDHSPLAGGNVKW